MMGNAEMLGALIKIFVMTNVTKFCTKYYSNDENLYKY